MLVAFYDVEIKYRTIGRGQLLYAPDNFLHGHFAQRVGLVGLDIVGSLQIVGSASGLHPVVVDRGIDDDASHPCDQAGSGLVSVDIGEDLDEAFVEDVHGVIVVARVAEAYAHQERIVLLVKLFLGPALFCNARFYQVPFLLLQADRDTHNREVISG